MDNKTLRIIRGAIAMKSKKNKDLAFALKLAPATLSEFLHGYRPMPYHVQEYLIKELDIRQTIQASNEQEALLVMA